MSVTPTSTSPRTAHAAATALRYADGVVVRCVRDTHRAIARRVFGTVPASRVPHAVHDAVSAVAYGGVSGGLRAVGGAVGRMGDAGVSAPVEDGSRARALRCVVNALVGDDLSERGDPYALPMALRAGGADVAATSEALAAAYRRATGDVAVLVHGLGEHDGSWDPPDPAGAYDRVLARRAGVTGVRLRYNTGLHVSDNGAALADLLDRLVDAWPVPVVRLHLVGHSMGGLVARSALAYGAGRRDRWTDRVATVVCLGSPHRGAALERVVHVGARGLRLAPQTQAFAAVLERRSAGIVDLRHGYVTREEWAGHDLAASWGGPRATLAPHPDAAHHVVAATVTGSPGHPLGVLVGDLVVGARSARDTTGDLAGATAHHLRATHLGLLHHPQVADWLVAWTSRPRPPRGPS